MKIANLIVDRRTASCYGPILLKRWPQVSSASLDRTVRMVLYLRFLDVLFFCVPQNYIESVSQNQTMLVYQ